MSVGDSGPGKEHRIDQRETGLRHLRGLMLDGQLKLMQPMAARLGVDHQQLQQFLTSSTWDVTRVRRRVATCAPVIPSENIRAACRRDGRGPADRLHRRPRIACAIHAHGPDHQESLAPAIWTQE
nr:transposase [Actinoplanes polyasparticus]